MDTHAHRPACGYQNPGSQRTPSIATVVAVPTNTHSPALAIISHTIQRCRR